MAENTVDRRRGEVKKVLTILSIVVLFGLVVFLFIQIGLLRDVVVDLREKIEKLSLDLWIKTLPEETNRISLTSEGLQSIEGPFVVVVDEVEQHLAGINIKGKMITTSSVTHENIIFDVTVAKQTKQFTILERINPGYSRNFKVYIPNVPIEEAEYATVEYVGSTTSWREHKEAESS